jgi:hypothetical protein
MRSANASRSPRRAGRWCLFPRPGLEIVRCALGAASGRVVPRADTVGRDEALRRGVVDEIAEPAVLLGRAVALASQLGSYPAAAYAAIKCDLQRPVLEAIHAGDAAAVTAAWSSPKTRQPLVDAISIGTSRFRSLSRDRRGSGAELSGPTGS